MVRCLDISVHTMDFLFFFLIEEDFSFLNFGKNGI
jgi:hypothetical protein